MLSRETFNMLDKIFIASLLSFYKLKKYLIKGKAPYFWDNGDKYEGDYKDNKKHGFGSYFYANGEKYEGEWFDDLKNGLGKMYFINGDVYRGTFLNDKKHGFGNYICGDEKLRKLILALNISVNSGSESNLDGAQSYSGDWENDTRTGYGQLWMLNGNRYKNDLSKNLVFKN